MARVEGRRHDGMELARYGLQVQPNEPDNHHNMALLYLMLGRRRAAMQALEAGLLHHPEHPRLTALHQEMGVRRPPVLRFLPRGNPLNVAAGKVRRWWEELRERLAEGREDRADARKE